jgi:hypothetical protein
VHLHVRQILGIFTSLGTFWVPNHVRDVEGQSIAYVLHDKLPIMAPDCHRADHTVRPENRIRWIAERARQSQTRLRHVLNLGESGPPQPHCLNCVPDEDAESGTSNQETSE